LVPRSYSVSNSITDVAPLADKFVEFVDAKVPDKGADVVQKAVDGILAIPDGKVSEYAGVLKQVVYKGAAPRGASGLDARPRTLPRRASRPRT